MPASPFVDVDFATGAVPLYLCTPERLDVLLESLLPSQAHWVRANACTAAPGTELMLPDASGALAGVIVGVDAGQPLWQLAGLPRKLPAGLYAIADDWGGTDPFLGALGWAIGALPEPEEHAGVPVEAAQLVLPRHEQEAVLPLAEAIGMVRNLVNAPANQLGPAELAAVVRALALEHGADYEEWVGDDLPGAGFPLVHAVGRAAAPGQAPRVIALHWGDPAAPRVVLVGKGVCFDSGGLDLKPA